MIPLAVCAQPSRQPAPQVITLEAVYDQVLSYHPLARQASLLGDIAQAELRKARSLFDPSVDIHWNQKTLHDKVYYTNWNNFVKVPTWWGPDVKLGYERYVGINVNPENFTPEDGLIYAEITVPLARNLLFDMRRNILSQARLLPQMNEAERLKLMNKLLLQVAKDYWDWYYTRQVLDVYTVSRDLARERLQFVQSSVLAGDLAAIDTVEARLELLEREVTLAEAQVRYRNAALMLSNHLWDAAGQPLELAENASPVLAALNVDLPPPQVRDSLQTWAREQHPELRKQQFSILQLEYDRRYYKQAFLPELSMDIKPFITPGDQVTGTGKFYWEDNFKVGFNFYTPIFLRKQRADYQLANIRLKTAQLSLEFSRREIVNENSAAWNDLETYVRLVIIQRQAVDYAQRLLAASIQKYRAGEGSLFLVNSYERKLIKEQTKMAELQGKYAKSLAGWYWSTGFPLEQVRF
ncbi:MAG: TolC family protein [Bacteroidetes bacterium]|nr:TolC family protein [Bacteroidota bacterium]